jgi:2'-5' RNA ligase
MNTFNTIDDVFNDLNIKYRSLGCVMLKVNPVPVNLEDIGGSDVLYVSKNPQIPWVNGFVNGKKPHVTLLYGLLDNVMLSHVNFMLKDINIPKTIKLSHITTFPSTMESEPYVCIVVSVNVNPLINIHEKLCMLPHISRYPGFKAHLTIAYVKAEYCTKELLDKLDLMCNGLELEVKELKFEPAGSII